MALIDRVDQYIVKLWISDDDSSSKEKKITTTNWTEETMSLPSSFESGRRLYVNPVQGTDELVIKSHIPADEKGFVSLYIYSRINKRFRKIDITGVSPLLRYPYTYGMHIYHESLLPVQDEGKKQDQPTPPLV
ncbi:hypothetical protein MKX03_030471 [Papaver bracteatum]|nr:hypothetical protein MKX03_030471 [Papaver bracteatum]